LRKIIAHEDLCRLKGVVNDGQSGRKEANFTLDEGRVAG